MSKIKDETIQRMEAQRAKLEARIQVLKNRKNAEERKKDTRRKILAGAFFIKLMGGDFRKVGEKLKEAGVLELRDFSLFDLEE